MTKYEKTEERINKLEEKNVPHTSRIHSQNKIEMMTKLYLCNQSSSDDVMTSSHFTQIQIHNVEYFALCTLHTYSFLILRIIFFSEDGCFVLFSVLRVGNTDISIFICFIHHTS